MYGVLKRKEMLALIIDWGYRADGVPVRLFGAWTTLPAGPAVLAAKTGAPIVHIAIRRAEDGNVPVTYSDRSRSRRRTTRRDPRARRRRSPTRSAATIAAAPEQWYSFKPLWPSTDEEKAALAARAGRSAGGSEGSGALAPAG